jgi:hypothetical protein
MGVSLMHRSRRIGGTLALLGMAFYVVLLPWHSVSQATMLLVQAELGTDAIPMCRGGLGRADQPTKEPSKPTHCPICSGYAALHFAVEGSAGAVLALSELGSLTFDSTEDHLAPALARVPQSRGPPSLLT